MRKIVYYILLILFLSDLVYSFYQHFHIPLEGDVAEIVMPTPTEGYYHVLHDPLGLGALLEDEIYPNPNRFFAHRTSSEYFLYMPLLLQNFTAPVDSVYLSAAIAKTIVQILIIWILAVYISNTRNVFRLDFLIAVVLIFPLFQTLGYTRFMGIIDPSVIYTFFYALPLGLLLLFFRPFFKALFYNKKPGWSWWFKILLGLFIVVLSLNGPLGPGVVLIACPMVLLNEWVKSYRRKKEYPFVKRIFISIGEIPSYLLFYFIGICLLSLYSLYIGQNNALNQGQETLSLLERYARIPDGLHQMLTRKLGLPLLIMFMLMNAVIIRRHYRAGEGEKILKFMRWFGVFALIYIFLLPLGGYRIYRPGIVRYDTLMPVILGLMFVYGFTTFYLVKNIAKRYRKIYLAGITVFLLIYTIADTPDASKYECERNAMETIAQSPDATVVLDTDCPVMEWRITYDPVQTDLNSALFHYWNITTEKKRYYHRQPDPDNN